MSGSLVRSGVLPGVVLLGLATSTCEEPLPPELVADVIFLGGPVITIEDGTAGALAVKGERILAVGDEAAVRRYEGAGTAVVDLAGRALVPGFIDGHSHLIAAATPRGKTPGEAIATALRYGYTMSVELTGHQHNLDLVRTLDAAGELRLRVSIYPVYNESFPDSAGRSIYLGTWYPDNAPIRDTGRRLRIPGIKVFVDGAFSRNRGCYALSEPYPPEYQGDPCFGTNGALFLGGAELADIIVDAQEAGFDVAMHAIGDMSLDTALFALEEARARTGERARHQLHHNHFMRPDHMSRYIALDVPYGTMPWFHNCDVQEYYNAFGEDRVAWYGNRYALAEAGGRAFVETDFGWHSDPDADRFFNRPLDPLVNLWTLMTHKERRGDTVCDPEPWRAAHPIGLDRALRMHTLDAAYAHGMDAVVGSLRPDKYADLVILSDDPTAVPVDDIPFLHVVMTMVGGKVEYCVADCPL